MQIILNLTYAPATQEQIEAGVIEPKDKLAVKRLLSFSTPPTKNQIKERTIKLANIANEHGVGFAMVGDVSYLTAALEKQLRLLAITPVHNFIPIDPETDTIHYSTLRLRLMNQSENNQDNQNNQEINPPNLNNTRSHKGWVEGSFW